LASQVKFCGKGPAGLSPVGWKQNLFWGPKVPDKGLKQLNWGYTTEPSITPGVL
jgi:hypothetical protein